MHIVTVIPLARGIGKETLSYYCKDWIPTGSAITVPLRNKEILVLVASCTPAREQKANVKSASYSLRRIDTPTPRRIVLDPFITAAQTMAHLHGATTGSVLHSLLPTSLMEASTHDVPAYTKVQTTMPPEPRVLHAPFFDRPSLFRRLVREVLANQHSCLLITPTIRRAQALFEVLSRGIEDDSFLLHSDLSPAVQRHTWIAAQGHSLPTLIVATAGYIALPRGDIGTLILEGESDSAYTLKERPYVNIRLFVEEYARALGAQLHLADTMFRVETYYAYKEGTYDASLPFSLRTTSNISDEVVDMNIDTSFVLKKTMNPKTITIPLISTTVVTKLSINQTAGRNTFLFVNRKGLAPQTICGDCGTPIACPSCGLPAMLHQTASGKRMYACHHCQEELPAEMTCPHCRGWRLVPLGIGCDGVREELERLFPETPIIQIDSAHTKTKQQAQKAYRTFKDMKGGVMIGTEMALRVIDEPIPAIAVISIDNRFSIPDFRIHENMYRTLTALREKSDDPLVIQTRHPKHPLFHFFTKKSYEDFYEHELSERRTFGYPPFATLIRLALTGERTAIQKQIDLISDDLNQHELVAYDALRPAQKGKHTAYILIKVPTSSWQRVARGKTEEGDEPYQSLLSYLRSLPLSITIEYDPANIM